MPHPRSPTIWMGIGELGEAIGGETFGVLGPLAAVTYAVVALVALHRSRRDMRRPDEVRAQGGTA